jgi:cysteine desulfurase
MTYFDNNATALMRESARQKMIDAMGYVGNASSAHSHGRTMRKFIEDARADIAMLCGCDSEHVIFTSGGTEAIAMVLCHFKADGVLISSIEHNAALENAKNVPRIPVDEHGVICLKQTDELIKQHKPKLLSIIYASNETGVIQPVKELVGIAHANDCLIHIDAVQAAGKIPLDFNGLGADYMSIAAHKIGGPQGAGALIKAPSRPVPRLICGGSQERHQRAGTENVAGIVGFGAAAKEAIVNFSKMKELETYRDDLEQFIRQSSNAIIIWGENTKRITNTSMISVPGIASETLVMIMDLNGIAVGSGAACSSGTVKPSHVLVAMGSCEDNAKCCMRISLGWQTNAEDIQKFKNAWLDMMSKIGHKIKTP